MDKKKAEAIVDRVKKYFKSLGEEVPEYEWGFFDHTHEDLSPGAWVLTCEGYLEYDWPFAVSSDEQLRAEVGADVLLEPVNGCVLGIYDA